ncbi:MAG: polyprenyl synthetase family protein [Firmicutes bacterium]|nr:polyprenyl synthetase family protein [Bacillota bacterium]
MAGWTDWKDAHGDFTWTFDRRLQAAFSRLEPAWLSSFDEVTGERISEEEIRLMGRQLEMGEAYTYASFGGKRVRPFLMALAYGLLGADPMDRPALLDLAISLELIHSYSLVHDDLPAMDNDQLRRGQATCHVRFGEDRAILVGDGLLNLSMEVALEALLEAPHEEKERVTRAMEVLYRLSGLHGMVGGQALDLRPDLIQDPDWARIMVEKKTCALFMAACKMGIILAGGDSREEDRAEAFGYHLGMAYQMKDDVFDQAEDRANQKRTLADDLGLEGLELALKEETEKALALLEDFDRPGLMRDFARALVERKK